MKRIVLVAATLVFLTGCATNPDGSVNQNQRAQTGAIIGAIGGGVVGKQVGGRQGTVIGAIIGGIGGAAIGGQLDKQQQELNAALEANAALANQIEVQRIDDRTISLTFDGEVTFDTGSAVLRPEFRSALNDVVASARRYNTTRIRVIGHTDNVGGASINQRLSQQRAQSVANYIEDRGIDRARLEAIGRGDTQPVASNTTASGRAQNRRVEILLINEN